MATLESVCCSSGFPSHMTRLFIERPIISLIVANGSDKWQTATEYASRTVTGVSHFPKKRCVSMAIKTLSMTRPATASNAVTQICGVSGVNNS
jgi:hypothetical protein